MYCSPSRPQTMPSGISSGPIPPPPSRTSLLWFQLRRSGLSGRNPPQIWQPSATRWAVKMRRIQIQQKSWKVTIKTFWRQLEPLALSGVWWFQFPCLERFWKHQLKFFSWSCCAYYGLEGSMLQLFAGLFHPSSKNKCSVHLNKPWPIKAL